MGYRRVSVAADLISAVGMGAISLLYATVGLALWQLLALVFIGGLLSIPGLTACRSMLPELAALAGWRLERMNAAFEGISFAAVLVGPVTLGVLVSVLGAADVLWLDAASFVFSVALIRLAVPPLRAAVDRSDLAIGAQLTEGVTFSSQ